MMRFNDFLDAANTRICKAAPAAKVSIRWISKPQEEARIDVFVQAGSAKAAVSLNVSSAYRSYDYEHRNNYEYYKRNGTLENMADICLDSFTAAAKQAISAIKNTITKNDGKVLEGAAFANNYYIDQKISLPDSIEVIGAKAFWCCSSIKQIVFPHNLVEIGDSAFRGSCIESVELFSGVKHIRAGAFLECTRLRKVLLPEGLEEIGNFAFQGCYGLKEINIPSTVQKFGKAIFEDCKALKKLTCFDNFTIETDTFGTFLPTGLIKSLETLENKMTTSAFQKYVLVDKVWSKLNLETQASFFVKRNSKGSLFCYSKCIKKDDVEQLGESLLKKAAVDKSNDLNRALYNFITLFHDLSSREQAIKMLAILKNRKNTEKLIAGLEQLGAIKQLFNEVSDVQTPSGVALTPGSEELSYETIDSLDDDFFADMVDFDLHTPIKTKLKKVIVTVNDLKFIVKFQSNQTLNNELSGLSTEMYDPFYVIDSGMYEEFSETADCQPDGRPHILIDARADHISTEVFIKRLKFFAKTVDSLRNENVLRGMIEMMPKKKNGTLFVKRTSVIAPIMLADSFLGFYVLCAKAIKDTEAEINLKYYSFRRMEEVHDFLKTANDALRSIMKYETL